MSFPEVVMEHVKKETVTTLSMRWDRGAAIIALIVVQCGGDPGLFFKT